MMRMLTRCAALPLLALGACSVPYTVGLLGETSPPPAHGRPVWVTVFADVGAWVGGAVGGVGSIVLLPVTYPISLLADEGLNDDAAAEFVWFPATILAGAGHAALSWPADMLDWTFRRAWFDTGEPVPADEPIPTLDGFALPRASSGSTAARR